MTGPIRVEDNDGKLAEDDGELDAEGEGTGDEKYVRMREKNRRAQQRFRQRQKVRRGIGSGAYHLAGPYIQ